MSDMMKEARKKVRGTKRTFRKKKGKKRWVWVWA